MPRRTGGGTVTSGSVEAGIRQLAVGPGPSVDRLVHEDDPGIRSLLNLAHTNGHWTPEQRAFAVLAVVTEVAGTVIKPAWQPAVEAALRTPSESYQGMAYDSLSARWRQRAELEGASGAQIRVLVERYRGYWVHGAARIAASTIQRCADLTRLDAWEPYRRQAARRQAANLPLSFSRTDVLYSFEGRRGVKSVTYRWVTAHEAIRHYEAHGWYYSDPDAPVKIEPLANCSLSGPLRDLPQGGRAGKLLFGHELSPGEQYFFAYSTVFHSDRECRPAILYELRGKQMNLLILRVQFDVTALPTRCWYVDIEGHIDDWEVPADGAAEVLPVPANGYVEHQFRDCERLRKYGLRWTWPQTVGRGDMEES